MIILSFESSCDETSCAVVRRDEDRFTVLSDIIASQVDIHKLYGGVVPEIASRAHTEAISRITYEALDKANIKIGDVDLIAFTAHPGLIGALLVGVNFAKSLAYASNIPFVAVDHIKGHAGAAYLTGEGEPKAPFLALIVSGGHTAIYLAKSDFDYEMVGTTRDDAAGESFDKVGRILGIPYPAGVGFDLMAQKGFEKITGDGDYPYTKFAKIKKKSDFAIKLPSPAIADESFDFSFSGLKTAAINTLHRYEQKGEDFPKEEFAAAYTYEAIGAIDEKLEGAIDKYKVKTLVLAGGVAANSHLRKTVINLCEKKGVKLFCAPISLCGDNAAMIGVAGYFAYMKGERANLYQNAYACDKIEKIK